MTAPTAGRGTGAGNLCVKAGWPSMFVTYLNNESAYNSKFRDGWYYTGDTARKDNDGYYWFMGRSDDVINTAGHLISRFEVESALLAGGCGSSRIRVIGAPDDLLFEKVVAFVHLHSCYQPTKDLEIKIRLHVSNRASSIATPQEINLCDSIPNKSGKIMRRVLKARYLGADPGDTSTLEI